MSQQFAPEYQDTPVVLVSPQLLIFFRGIILVSKVVVDWVYQRELELHCE